MQLRKESLKKIQAWKGFEPMTSEMPVQCSTNWAIKPTGSLFDLSAPYIFRSFCYQEQNERSTTRVHSEQEIVGISQGVGILRIP